MLTECTEKDIASHGAATEGSSAAAADWRAIRACLGSRGINRVTRDLEAARAALAWLEAPAQLLIEAKARLGELMGQHCAALRDWYAGGAEGSRPR
jgi:hypothetical protein